jgi:hypothetical protein
MPHLETTFHRCTTKIKGFSHLIGDMDNLMNKDNSQMIKCSTRFLKGCSNPKHVTFILKSFCHHKKRVRERDMEKH